MAAALTIYTLPFIIVQNIEQKHSAPQTLVAIHIHLGSNTQTCFFLFTPLLCFPGFGIKVKVNSTNILFHQCVVPRTNIPILHISFQSWLAAYSSQRHFLSNQSVAKLEVSSLNPVAILYASFIYTVPH